MADYPQTKIGDYAVSTLKEDAVDNKDYITTLQITVDDLKKEIEA